MSYVPQRRDGAPTLRIVLYILSGKVRHLFIVIGKTCAIVPKIITGDKYGKAIDSTDIIKTHNATRLLTLTNLEQVYKYSYFVPTSSIGVELLTRTAALTRNELNEMISVWLDEMAESHTTVTTGRYVEAYINEQK